MNELVALGGLTVQATADLIGCHRTLLHRWMSGAKVPEARYLARMIEIGWSVDWLLAGQGSPQVRAAQDENYAAGFRMGLREASVRVMEHAVKYEGETKPSSKLSTGEILEAIRHAEEGPSKPGRSKPPRKKARGE